MRNELKGVSDLCTTAIITQAYKEEHFLLKIDIDVDMNTKTAVRVKRYIN